MCGNSTGVCSFEGVDLFSALGLQRLVATLVGWVGQTVDEFEPPAFVLVQSGSDHLP
jgi:hypothetical protein